MTSQWLADVGLIVRAYNTKQISAPLEVEKIPSEFKVFYIDTGLLVSQLGDDAAAKILNGELGAYKGAIAENMVASAFATAGKKLYYFHAPSGSPELDFLVEKNGQVAIIECKASNNKATSMKFVIANQQKYGTHPAIKIADANIGGGNGFDTFPLYSLGFLTLDQPQPTVPLIDASKIRAPNE